MVDQHNDVVASGFCNLIPMWAREGLAVKLDAVIDAYHFL